MAFPRALPSGCRNPSPIQGLLWVKRREPRGHGRMERRTESCPRLLWLKGVVVLQSCGPTAVEGRGQRREDCIERSEELEGQEGGRIPSLQPWPSEGGDRDPVGAGGGRGRLRPWPLLSARNQAEPPGLRAWPVAQSSARWHQLPTESLISAATGRSRRARRRAPKTRFREGRSAVPGGGGLPGPPYRLHPFPWPHSCFPSVSWWTPNVSRVFAGMGASPFSS